MVFYDKAYDPKKLEELGLELEGEVIKEKDTGTVVSSGDGRVRSATKTKVNWNWVGPLVAILIFILGWATVVSERAWTATINVDRIEQQQQRIVDQQVQIDELKKANERQEILIERQMQVLKRQDEVMNTRERYADKRLEAIEKDILTELRALRLECGRPR